MKMDPAVAAIRRAVRVELADLAPGDRVLAAVSGGPDSLALAAALAAEAAKLTLRAGAVTVDHNLQDGSAARAAIAVDTCVELGLEPVVSELVAVDARSPAGLEAAAREQRYKVMSETADVQGAAAVLLGHTLDDQAETVLMRLARGSGARSLAAMPTRRGIYRRPLLGIRRGQTLAACAAWGLAPWHDPHNCDPAFTRVRVRRDLLPAMTAALGPGVPEALARTAAMLRDDADALDQWAATVTDPADAKVLAALPAAIRRRVLRGLALDAGAPAGALTAEHVQQLDRLVTAWHGQMGVSLPGGLVATRACDRLRFL